MGSKAVNVRQAMIIAIVFEFAGAFFGGTGVTETLRDGIFKNQLIIRQSHRAGGGNVGGFYWHVLFG